MKKQTKPQQNRNKPVINKGVKAAAVLALAPLALTGCPTEIEYRDVPGPTEYVNYSFSYGNIYVSFTDSAWQILNDSGKMGEFKTKIDELSKGTGDWPAVVSDYIKSKPKYEIIIAYYNTAKEGEIVSRGDIISVNVNTTDPDIIQILRNRIALISDDMRDEEGLSMKANDSSIRMAGAGPMPKDTLRMWRRLGDEVAQGCLAPVCLSV
jgi:hypothetical protein